VTERPKQQTLRRFIASSAVRQECERALCKSADIYSRQTVTVVCPSNLTGQVAVTHILVCTLKPASCVEAISCIKLTKVQNNTSYKRAITSKQDIINTNENALKMSPQFFNGLVCKSTELTGIKCVISRMELLFIFIELEMCLIVNETSNI
jgi:hypothetical protein